MMKCPRCNKKMKLTEETMTKQVFICICELKVTCEEMFV